MIKSSEQRKRDFLAEKLRVYGETVDLGLGDRIHKSYINGGGDVVYEVSACGEFQTSFSNPHDALTFVLGEVQV